MYKTAGCSHDKEDKLHIKHYTSHIHYTLNHPLINVAIIVVADISTRKHIAMIKRFFAYAQNDILVTGY